jgi:ATP-dependent Clp protease ATP-binding subunit ClpA
VFERFTERARQVVVLAQDEARALGHNYLGTEHILLGLLREDEGLAARMLESFGIRLEEVRAKVVRLVGQGDEVVTGQIPFTKHATRVLELALREALSLGHNYIGTEHILLGLIRENESVAARILLDYDADGEKVRGEVIRMLRSQSGERFPPGAESEVELVLRRVVPGSVTMKQAESATATFGRKPACIVPKVKAMSLKVARQRITRAHCRTGKITRRYSTVKKGHVISQKPTARRHLRSGAKINLAISKGRRP